MMRMMMMMDHQHHLEEELERLYVKRVNLGRSDGRDQEHQKNREGSLFLLHIQKIHLMMIQVMKRRNRQLEALTNLWEEEEDLDQLPGNTSRELGGEQHEKVHQMILQMRVLVQDIREVMHTVCQLTKNQKDHHSPTKHHNQWCHLVCGLRLNLP
jgi:hypothetical protein